jgi:hypothetical protein
MPTKQDLVELLDAGRIDVRDFVELIADLEESNEPTDC